MNTVFLMPDHRLFSQRAIRTVVVIALTFAAAGTRVAAVQGQQGIETAQELQRGEAVQERTAAAEVSLQAGAPRKDWGDVSLQFGLGVGEHYLRTALNYETPPLWTVQLGFWGRMDLSVETGLAYWGNTRKSVHDDELYQLTLLPLLRWWVFDPFFIEGGIGPSVFNKHHFAGKDISTDFQFADHIGGGVRLSESLRLSVRYAHFSNGGIRKPNPGLNVITLSLAYDF